MILIALVAVYASNTKGKYFLLQRARQEVFVSIKFIKRFGV
ncbi:hypothetical protein GXM_07931 [Nostoc sphaeroides CCNUC1]|uniref:Uncharacterized protein n=1 Tax=Nostoc sphaeroides CCNUC1 TaxID=2653204 RepID=A0A5P8WC93_9NOSO|nr:hypothetical protein GXM_07931 [Nostoc sphaeroides CCNUC1]